MFIKVVIWNNGRRESLMVNVASIVAVQQFRENGCLIDLPGRQVECCESYNSLTNRIQETTK